MFEYNISYINQKFLVSFALLDKIINLNDLMNYIKYFIKFTSKKEDFKNLSINDVLSFCNDIMDFPILCNDDYDIILIIEDKIFRIEFSNTEFYKYIHHFIPIIVEHYVKLVLDKQKIEL